MHGGSGCEGRVWTGKTHPEHERPVRRRAVEERHRVLRGPVILVQILREARRVAESRVDAGLAVARRVRRVRVHGGAVVQLNGRSVEHVAVSLVRLGVRRDHVILPAVPYRIAEAEFFGVIRVARVVRRVVQQVAERRGLREVVLTGRHRMVSRVLQRRKVRGNLDVVIVGRVRRHAAGVVVAERRHAAPARGAHDRLDVRLFKARAISGETSQVRDVELVEPRVPVVAPLVRHEEEDRRRAGARCARGDEDRREIAAHWCGQNHRSTERACGVTQIVRPLAATARRPDYPQRATVTRRAILRARRGSAERLTLGRRHAVHGRARELRRRGRDA
mmetsp:Transcript_14270/g.44142  ORF Transcript_14270/g.44142 Transcript_14270/m.44142 type:complete len:334 (+) Transcript_14270:797-1798(+)